MMILGLERRDSWSLRLLLIQKYMNSSQNDRPDLTSKVSYRFLKIGGLSSAPLGQRLKGATVGSSLSDMVSQLGRPAAGLD